MCLETMRLSTSRTPTDLAKVNSSGIMCLPLFEKGETGEPEHPGPSPFVTGLLPNLDTYVILVGGDKYCVG